MERAMIERLVGEYRSAATLHDEPDDGTREWRERVNRAAGRMVVIARELAAGGADAVGALALLLESDDRHVALPAAHHLLDFAEPGDAARAKALSLIERAALAGGPQAALEKEWLENWSAERQDE